MCADMLLRNYSVAWSIMFGIPVVCVLWIWWILMSDVVMAGMALCVSGWTLGVQVKLWDPLRTCAIPERLRGVFTMRRCTNPRFPLPLFCLSFLVWAPPSEVTEWNSAELSHIFGSESNLKMDGHNLGVSSLRNVGPKLPIFGGFMATLQLKFETKHAVDNGEEFLNCEGCPTLPQNLVNLVHKCCSFLLSLCSFYMVLRVAIRSQWPCIAVCIVLLCIAENQSLCCHW